jgi:hypothetical protein
VLSLLFGANTLGESGMSFSYFSENDGAPGDLFYLPDVLVKALWICQHQLSSLAWDFASGKIIPTRG